MVGYIEWFYVDLKNKLTLGVKRGKHVSDKETEVQVFYNKFKKRNLESEARHCQLHEDNAKKITKMGRELEFWRNRSLNEETKVQKLHDKFDK